MAEPNIVLNAERAHQFAMAILDDIDKYIQDHQEEFNAFLLQEAEEMKGGMNVMLKAS